MNALRADPRSETRRGMMLLEVTSTVAFLTTVALSISLMVVPIARQSRLNKEVSTANAEAKQLLERIQATPFNELLASYPDGMVEVLPDLPGGQLTVQYEDVNADPLLVEVQLVWDSPEFGLMQRTFHSARTE
ncbi:MAG: hypothetical protein O7J95_18625 [Planctomycetota bacterium]|nr:hypothetical protein [Planctomycetota bacterium]